MGEVSKLLAGETVIGMARGDVLALREKGRRRRLSIIAAFLALPVAFLWYRIADGRPFNPFAFPQISEDLVFYIPMILIGLVIVLVMVVPFVGAGRSPHVTFRPEQIDVSLDDVKGLDAIREEVVRTLNIFLAYATYRREMGGNPRRGVLFDGPPGTGKTHLAKAMARHAGVPFLFVSGPAFQSMWYGQTARKIRRYFKALKKTAHREGGAIGFIEEIDAFATRRGGLNSSTPAPDAAHMTNASVAQGTGGTVNELLIQMQSFDTPMGSTVVINKLKDMINALLPANRQLRKRAMEHPNVLVIAATNRGDMLDPALLRPGRFDRRLYFDLPSHSGRRELIDHFLARRKHGPELDDDDMRERLAGMTFGYTPAMLEHIFDESLVWALRAGREVMEWEDLTRAKLTIEIGLPHPVTYSVDERRIIATHEAGHAVAAYLAGEGRKLEVLSIIKRRDALGLLGHSDAEERFTKTRSEMEALLTISMAGMAAEEIFEGQSGTGPAGDLATATTIAAEMVGSLGFGGSLVSYRAVGEGLFDQGLVGRVLSNPDTKRAIDKLLDEQKKRATTLLERNQHLVLALRDALLDRDELIGSQIVEVLEAAGGRTTPRARRPSSGRSRQAVGASKPRRAPRAR